MAGMEKLLLFRRLMKRVFQTHSGETTPLPASMPQTARPAQREVIVGLRAPGRWKRLLWRRVPSSFRMRAWLMEFDAEVLMVGPEVSWT